jgi:hypothetical protein
MYKQALTNLSGALKKISVHQRYSNNFMAILSYCMDDYFIGPKQLVDVTLVIAIVY